MKKQYDFSESVPNRHLNKVKKGIHIRLDHDVVEWLKAQAENHDIGYQTFTNALLREAMVTSAPKSAPDEKAIRRIVRDELKKRRA